MNMTEHDPECIVSILDDASEEECSCGAFLDAINRDPERIRWHDPLQSCGHPVSSIVSSDEGTNYCRECEDNGM